MTVIGSQRARSWETRAVVGVLSRTREQELMRLLALQYSDIAGLEQSIDAAYSIASQRLFDIFFDKFRLLVHLKALKNYMFLEHGDFAESLMDSLASVYPSFSYRFADRL